MIFRLNPKALWLILKILKILIQNQATARIISTQECVHIIRVAASNRLQTPTAPDPRGVTCLSIYCLDPNSSLYLNG